jgi:hypothetical protein
LAEAGFWRLPKRARHRLRDSQLAFALFGVNVVATN